MKTVVPFQAKVKGLAVNVPEDARDFAYIPAMTGGNVPPVLTFWTGSPLAPRPGMSNYLPHGNWSVLGPVDKLTEEQAAQVVEQTYFWSDIETWFNYGMKDQVVFAMVSATESLRSLLTSLGISNNSKWIVLIEQKQ